MWWPGRSVAGRRIAGTGTVAVGTAGVPAVSPDGGLRRPVPATICTAVSRTAWSMPLERGASTQPTGGRGARGHGDRRYLLGRSAWAGPGFGHHSCSVGSAPTECDAWSIVNGEYGQRVLPSARRGGNSCPQRPETSTENARCAVPGDCWRRRPGFAAGTGHGGGPRRMMRSGARSPRCKWYTLWLPDMRKAAPAGAAFGVICRVAVHVPTAARWSSSC